MKIPGISAALILLLLPVEARAGGSGERKLKYFATYDYFLPSNSDQGLRDQAKSLSDGLLAAGADSTSFSINTKGGNGTRVGAMVPFDGRTWLGGSLGYILGPTLNSNFSEQSVAFGNGGLTVNRAVVYVRMLMETQIRFPLGKGWTGSLGSNWGAALGRVDQSCASSGILTCGGSASRRSWVGFAWEFSPSVSYHVDSVAADLTVGARYAGFPRYRGDDQIAPIVWTAVGFYLGAAF